MGVSKTDVGLHLSYACFAIYAIAVTRVEFVLTYRATLE